MGEKMETEAEKLIRHLRRVTRAELEDVVEKFPPYMRKSNNSTFMKMLNFHHWTYQEWKNTPWGQHKNDQ